MNLNEEKIDKINVEYKKYLNTKYDYDKTINNQLNFKNIIIDLSITIVLSLGIYFINNNILTLGDLVTFNTLILFF
jgi:competence factor transporting protein